MIGHPSTNPEFKMNYSPKRQRSDLFSGINIPGVWENKRVKLVNDVTRDLCFSNEGIGGGLLYNTASPRRERGGTAYNTPLNLSRPVSPVSVNNNIEQLPVYPSPLTSPRHFVNIGPKNFEPVLPVWAYSGFTSMGRVEGAGFFYRKWAEKPERIVSDEEQRLHIKSLITKYLDASVKELIGLDMIKRAVSNGNKWMESSDFLDLYTNGRERGHMRIYHDPSVPVVKPYRPQLIDERRYVSNPNSFDMTINRQFRVNPIHLEVYKEMLLN